MKIPRILLSAPASGSGKTLITCGILNLLKRKGLDVASFKCGPDYIDPMFHTAVIGTRSRNLDLFFADGDTARWLFARHAGDCDIAVVEGVMGYYDGLAGASTDASAWDVARTTGTPTILLADARGTSVSLAALIRGFASFREPSGIGGVILNRLSPMLYGRMKELIERETGIPVLGYVPVLKDCLLESRHLGLLLPTEVDQLKEKLDRLSRVLEETLDLEGLLRLAGSAPDLTWDREKLSPVRTGLALWEKTSGKEEHLRHRQILGPSGRPLQIGLARDEAFCFFYQDNLRLLEAMGAQLVTFSPLHDRELPPGLDGLLLHGGYPELYAEALGANRAMCDSVREAVCGGLPTVAECGGFLYLHGELEDMEGRAWPMAGVIPGKGFYTGKLGRFGYVTLSEGRAFGREVGALPAHEFHYFDSPSCGEAFRAQKPLSSRSWRCIHSTDTLLAGFPHFYYYGNPLLAEAFLLRAQSHAKEKAEADRKKKQGQI